ncbi:TonB-dependent receptor [Bacteroidia bacterium]|nr:TonB-dependent receptor [Bacteroidia bacterium]
MKILNKTFILLICLTQSIFAQKPIQLPEDTVSYLTPAYFDLQEVVISGSSSQLQRESVMNVEKLNLTNNSENQGLSLAQKLSSVAGVSNFSTGGGIGKPVIRGLSGNRVAVFSQGIRVENQQWGDEHGLGLDENGYEQVEIIKGPASLLYGSDALGGVLYFNDEHFAKENGFGGAIHSEYTGNTNGWRNTGTLKGSENRWHWNLFGGYTTHEDYRDGNNQRVENSRFHTGNLKTAVGYTGQKFNSSLKYSYLNEQYGLTEAKEALENATVSKRIRKPDFPYQGLITHIISSENTFSFDNHSELKVDAGYIFNSRKEFEEATEDGNANLDMDLGTFSYTAKWYSPLWNDRWKLIAGSQGMFQTNTNHGEERLIPDASTTDAAVFAMVDYYYAEKSYWQMGVRVDGRQIKGSADAGFSKSYTAFNFSTGIYQQLNERLSARANLSSGYRAPNMFELLSDGIHEGTNRYEIGNETLKTENSYQADVSLKYTGEHLELFVNPYINYIRHYIYLLPADEIREDMPVYLYAQEDACLYGGEAGFHLHPHPWDWLHLEGSFATTFGQDVKHNDLPLMPSQKLNVALRADFSGKKIVRKFSVWLQEQYSFAQNQVAVYEEPTPAYSLLNAGISFDLKAGSQKILFNVMVSNLLNETYFDHLSRYKQLGLYDRGRSVNLQLAIPFLP